MSTRRRVRELGVAAAALAVTLGLGGLVVRRATMTRPVTPTHSAPASTSGDDGARAPSQDAPPATYDAAVVQLTEARKTTEVLADTARGSWSRRAKAASVQMGYAQLTGDYDAYAAADRSLAEAFQVARRSIDDGAVGPLLLKAQLSYELHRMSEALASLDVPEQQATYFHDKKLLSEITSLRGAVTFAMGRYDEGLGMLREAALSDPTPGHKQRLAIALAKIGEDDEATRLFDETEGGTQASARAPRSRAWLELQRALMDLERGRRVEARRRLESACAMFPGAWQTEEHLAELDAEEGRTTEAIAAYRSLVARTSDPEFMDALARLLPPGDESTALRGRANALYERRLALLPEATYGHALEHFLKMVEDPTRALTLAKKNVELRPDGEARTRLAQALVRSGRIAEARAEMRAVLATRWARAESWATAAVVFRLAGDERAAADAETKAKARNPRAMEEIAWLEPPKKGA